MPRVTREALTKRTVDAAKPTGQLYRMRDATVPGLVLRVTATGAKGWALTWGRGQERTIGPASTVTLEMARTQARILLAEVAQGGAPKRDRSRGTVADACMTYVDTLAASGRKAAATDAARRFDRTVYQDRLGKVRTANLTHRDVRDWRDRIERGDVKLTVKRGRSAESRPLSKATANRMRTVLVAALNWGVEQGSIAPDRAREWQRVKPHANANGRRELYLDIAQRRALLAAATPGLRDLIECVILTGCRAGDPAAVLRKHYDARAHTVVFSTKRPPSAVVLSPDASALFDRLAKDKLPAAPMFTNGGQPWQAKEWAQALRAAASDARLPEKVVMYTLRHSWITDAIMGGMDLLTVARQARTSLAMIEKHYGHLVLDAARTKLAGIKFI